MNVRILKNQKDFENFEKDVKVNHYRTPDDYPCIAIHGKKDIQVDWSTTGFRVRYDYEIIFLYPKDIQKELFNEDFEDLLKK